MKEVVEKLNAVSAEKFNDELTPWFFSKFEKSGDDYFLSFEHQYYGDRRSDRERVPFDGKLFTPKRNLTAAFIDAVRVALLYYNWGWD